MRKIHFLLGVHNHQPVGNFDFVIQEAFERAYRPFIQTLQKYPEIKCTFHFSGFLLEWMSQNAPDCIQMLKSMAQNQQVELFSGGYYEPILSIIPEKDRVLQIKGMSTLIERLFDVQPKGLWLAERVWEPHLASVLAKSGIEYVALDDGHFKNAGHYDDELNGYFITEDCGYPLKVFPMNKRLRYLVPFEAPEQTIQFLRERATENGENMFVSFDDGEKFGTWPGTHDLLYKERWLERFFALLVENSSWLETNTFSGYSQKYKPRARTYIPSSGYPEMMVWALPSRARSHFERLKEDMKRQGFWEKYSMFLKAGFWRTFLSKYTEANLMHKKMLFIRSQYTDEMPESILENIHKSQANDAYWHGFFGGLYLPNLRASVYEHLIKAQKEIDQFLHPQQDFIEVLEKDIDMDGSKEVLINTRKFCLGISPEKGGRIFEISVKDRNLNLSNTLSRRFEPYHEKITNGSPHGDNGGLVLKEKGLEKYLHYDWYERFSMMDHFFGEWNDLSKFSRSRYPEQGDFVNQRYDYKVTGRDTGEVKLWRRGHVWVGSRWLPVKVEKSLQIEDDGFFVTHCITNESDETIPLSFGCEYNINLMAPNSSERYFYCPEFEKKTLGESGRVKATFFGARSEYEGVDVFFQPNREVEFWFFPVYTVSYSESGLERIYQSSSITPVYRFQLEPMGMFQSELKVKIQLI